LARRPPSDAYKATPRPKTDGRDTPPTSILGATLVLRGELTLAEDLILEGCFDGRIDQGDHRLSIGEHARVRADIRTGSAVIAGSVEGDVRGQGTIVVTRTATLRGSLTAGRLSLDLRADLEDVVLCGEVTRPRYRDRRA
jgi:cytoskeletal protein CcmA (bactofilin family)